MAYVLIFLIIAADQLTKILYVSAGAPHITLIPHIVDLYYVENKGAAWGIFHDHQLLLYIISGIITLGLCVFFVWKYKKLNTLLRIALALIIAGSLGNLIDRVFLNYVRDMIMVTFIDFPIFNVADSAITIGGILLFIDVVFFEKEKKDESTEVTEELTDVTAPQEEKAQDD